MIIEHCACGLALHYSDPAIQACVEYAITLFGPTVAVVTRDGTWDVPRHYYALHGITVATLPRLARRHHWHLRRARQAVVRELRRAGPRVREHAASRSETR